MHCHVCSEVPLNPARLSTAAALWLRFEQSLEDLAELQHGIRSTTLVVPEVKHILDPYWLLNLNGSVSGRDKMPHRIRKYGSI